MVTDAGRWEGLLEALAASRGEAYRAARRLLLEGGVDVHAVGQVREQSRFWRVRLVAEALLLRSADPALAERVGASMRGEVPASSLMPVTGYVGAWVRSEQIVALGRPAGALALEILFFEGAPDEIGEAALLFAIVALPERRAAAPLIELVRDTRAEPSRTARRIEALSRLRDPVAVPVLIETLLDPERDASVRRAAAIALALLGAAEAAAPLEAVFVDAHTPALLRADAVAALARVAGPAAAGPILAALEAERDRELRRQIARALPDTRSPAALPALQRLAEDPDRHVRSEAARAAELLAKRLGRKGA